MRLDLQWGRDGVNSYLCPGAVAGYMFLPGHLCALVPCNVPHGRMVPGMVLVVGQRA